MNKFILLWPILFFTIIDAHPSEIIYKTSNEYIYSELSLLQSGELILSNSHAQTKREFNYHTQKSTITDADDFNYNANIKVSPYVSGYSSPYSDIKNYPLPLMYVFERQPKILTATLDASIGETYYSKAVFSMGGTADKLTSTGLYHPFSLDYYAAGDSPDEGYASISGNHYSITIGRFKGGIGHGLSGNLFQNSRAPFYDHLQMTMYNNFIKLYFMIGSSNYFLTQDELQIQNRIKDPHDYNQTWGTKAVNSEKIDYPADNTKMYAFHRIEIKPLKNLRLGGGEMNLVGGKFPDLNMINPFGFYHDSYDSKYHSYTFLFDITFAPINGNMLFFEFLSNDIHIPGEANQDPTAVGFQGGYWIVLPIKGSFLHRLGIEATHLDTWTYSDIVPYLTMYQRQVRRVATYDVPLGYSFGGDVEHFSLFYTLLNSDGFYIQSSIQRMDKGEIYFQLNDDNEMPYSNASKYQGRPSGTVEHWTTFETTAEIPIQNSLLFNALLHYSFIENFNHTKNRSAYLGYFSSGISFEF
jgi:hypothetical protein